MKSKRRSGKYENRVCHRDNICKKCYSLASHAADCLLRKLHAASLHLSADDVTQFLDAMPEGGEYLRLEFSETVGEGDEKIVEHPENGIEKGRGRK